MKEATHYKGGKQFNHLTPRHIKQGGTVLATRHFRNPVFLWFRCECLWLSLARPETSPLGLQTIPPRWELFSVDGRPAASTSVFSLACASLLRAQAPPTFIHLSFNKCLLSARCFFFFLWEILRSGFSGLDHMNAF